MAQQRHFKIVTKSFLSKKSRSDGIRVSVMRRHRPEYDFDVWLPKLAPTEPLLVAYVKKQTMGWKEFVRLYTKRVLAKNKKSLRVILKLAELSTVTLLCWEEEEEYCHRSLIRDVCLNMKKIEKGNF
jgi:uncharacterized protein YeaO (DUF488 family)